MTLTHSKIILADCPSANGPLILAVEDPEGVTCPDCQRMLSAKATVSGFHDEVDASESIDYRLGYYRGRKAAHRDILFCLEGGPSSSRLHMRPLPVDQSRMGAGDANRSGHDRPRSLASAWK